MMAPKGARADEEDLQQAFVQYPASHHQELELFRTKVS